MTWVQVAQGVAAIAAVVTPLVILPLVWLIRRLSQLTQTLDHFTQVVTKLDDKIEKHLDWHLDHTQQVALPQEHVRESIARSIKPAPRSAWEQNPLPYTDIT
jgi:uncharacterized protein YoxC